MSLYSIRNKLMKFTRIQNLHMSAKTNQITQIWDDIIQSYKLLLQEDSNISNRRWKTFRECMIQQHEETTIDFTIISILRQKVGPNAGIAYYKYLENNNYNPAIFTTLKYLELYVSKSSDITEEDIRDILNIYNDLMNKYKSFDAKVTNTLVSALCTVNKWEEADKVVQKYEECDSSITYAHNLLVSCLFNCGQDKLALKYLVNIMEKGVAARDIVYLAYLTYCTKDKSTFSEKIERIFTLWSKYGVKPSENVTFQYMTACSNYGWSACHANISKSICDVCNKNVLEIHLSDNNYTELIQAARQFLIENMYSASDPDEIKRFMKFTKKYKPFDVVLDTLNFLMSRKYKQLRLTTVVRSLVEKKQKVLLVGRKHISNYLKELSVKYDIYYFIVENWSNDDVFILYAAFLGGRKTRVVSQDFMRDKFIINSARLNTIFKKWQLSHQYVINNKNEWIKLYSEQVVDSIVGKQENNWHIPYLQVLSSKRHTDSYNWICINTANSIM